MATTKEQGVNLEGIEDVFRICGWQTGKDALEQRIAEYVEATDRRIQFFLKDMEKYNKPRLQGSPASEHNMSKTGMNYFAPMKNLQVLLADEWFNKVCTDKKKYTTAWRDKFVADLLASEFRDDIAKAWTKPDLRLQIKGHVMGALMSAGVFNKKALAIARIYYGTREENTKEVKTLAKYMGDSRKEYFTIWIKEYVAQS